MNTGYKQATIAYKVTNPGGEPLDINGELCAVSGRKQAIALLLGYVNPNPAKYEVETYYNAKGIISGNPTTSLDITSCPIGFIRVDQQTIELGNPDISASFTLTSSGRWHLVSGPIGYVDIDFKEGPAGKHTITVSGRSVGQGYFTFVNEVTGQTATVFVSVSGYIRITPDRLILDTTNQEAIFILDSSSSWRLVSGPTHLISIRGSKGEAGVNQITAKGVSTGQGYFTFVNEATGQTDRIFLAYVSAKPWVLENGKVWNMRGIWFKDSIWKFR